MARGTYYGGYFGSIAGVMNPCHPYWGNNEEWKEEFLRKLREREEEEQKIPQYERYLSRLIEIIRVARRNAKTNREYGELDCLLHYYWKRLCHFRDTYEYDW